MDSFDDCAGIVLCGGLSSRMGVSKPWLLWEGEYLLQRVIRHMGEVVSPVVVVSAVHQDLPDLQGDMRIVHDEVPGRGPLEGLRVGLQSLPPDREYAFVSSCDAPFLVAAVIRRLLSLRQGFDAVVPRDGSHAHPLCAVYRKTVLPQIETLRSVDHAGPSLLLHRVTTRDVDVNLLRDLDPELRSFTNLNTQESLRAAQQRPDSSLYPPPASPRPPRDTRE
ncbi:MAG TPA: molybdenum cofactor guanylyltransferase [Pirellulaceae bacterium]